MSVPLDRLAEIQAQLDIARRDGDHTSVAMMQGLLTIGEQLTRIAVALELLAGLQKG